MTSRPQSPQDPMLHDQLVTAERSVFGTRLPRPTGVGRHLFVVIVLSLVALGIAIFFAERGANEGPAPNGGAFTTGAPGEGAAASGSAAPAR